MPGEDARLEWVKEDFGSDPRVRVSPTTSALDEFPVAAFHVAVLVYRLRCELGPAAVAQAKLDDGSMVSSTRTWALHRARRTERTAGDFGDVVTVPARTLRIASGSRTTIVSPVVSPSFRDLGSRLRTVRAKMLRIRAPRHAWWFLRWLAGVVLGRAARFVRLRPHRSPAAVRPMAADGSQVPLGAEIAALGDRARAVFAATRRVAIGSAIAMSTWWWPMPLPARRRSTFPLSSSRRRRRTSASSYADPAINVVGGGAPLVTRHDLERAGGWRRMRRHVDQALIADVGRAGGRIYQTHGAGFALVRHGHHHTWEMEGAYFLERADEVHPGWDPVLADLADVPPPPLQAVRP